MNTKSNITNTRTKYVRLKREVGTKVNSDGEWVPVYRDFYGETEAEALVKYHEFMNTHREPTLDQSKLPMREVIEEWLETFFANSELADSTKILYANSYKNYLSQTYIADLPLCEVTPRIIQEFYNECPFNYSALKSLNKLLMHFYRHCAIMGICDDITPPLKVPKKNKNENFSVVKNVDVWDDYNLQKLIRVLYGTKLRFLVVLAVNSGARFSELLALTYDDVDENNNLIINKQITDINFDGKTRGTRLAQTKTESSNRVLVLSKAVAEEFEMHKKIHKAEMLRYGYTTNIIFSTNRGTYENKSNIRDALRAVYRRSGIPYHPFHSFRHTFGTNLSRAGVPIERTAKLMGHSSIDVTEQYYVNLGHEEKVDAVTRIAKYSFGE